jgi:hypothetical protein
MKRRIKADNSKVDNERGRLVITPGISDAACDDGLGGNHDRAKTSLVDSFTHDFYRIRHALKFSRKWPITYMRTKPPIFFWSLL